MRLSDSILKHWRKKGLIGYRPSRVEQDMAHEAAVAVRIVMEENTKRYEISWVLIIWLCIIIFVLLVAVLLLNN